MIDFRKDCVGLYLVLSAAVMLRGAVLWVNRENLSDDRDAYLGLAESVAAGHGFATPETDSPTAYRPPLYPLILAGIVKLGVGTVGIGLLHGLLGTLTVLLTYGIGRELGLRGGAVAAAGLVAVDPILLRYTAFPMTETVFTFLAALLMFLIVKRAESGELRAESQTHRREAAPPADRLSALRSPLSALLSTPFLIGFTFGLCALCRPTIWAFGALSAGWWLMSTASRRAPPGPQSGWSGASGTLVTRLRSAAHVPWVMGLTVALTVSPWVVRNALVFGRPILTTTHGGYTLLLGNNPVFYEEVVAQPWGTVWDDAPNGRTQAAWFHGVQADMLRELGPQAGEPEQDAWMSRRARQNIAEHPGLFLKSCWLRFCRMWNVVPLGSGAESLPRPVYWGIGLYYSVVTVGFLWGLVRLNRSEWSRWMPLLLLIVSFSLVHLVYWSNARMRAPLIPAVALFVVRGVLRGTRTTPAEG